MRVDRLRIRFEDPRMAAEQAQAIAHRISELVTGQRETAAVEPDEGLARHVAGAITHTLRTVGE